MSPSPGSRPETQHNAVAGRYLPALDGVRALAIIAVILYHLGYGWAAGGYMGVDLFFVLSGFLITSLLIEERDRSGRMQLRSFWARRARRLLPALLVMIGALAILVAIDPGTTDLSEFRADALSTILYFANWHLLLAHQSYFTQFEAPSPLAHTWSLAIEEQFYLVWPFVILAVLSWRSRRHRSGGPSLPEQTSTRESGRSIERWRKRGLTITVLGATASAGWMAYLWHSGAGLDRVYYGTDTRAFDLMTGAAAAMFACRRAQPGPRARRLLHFASPAGLAVLATCFALGAGDTSGPRTFMFYGGFLGCAVASAVVVSDVRQLRSGPVGRALSIRPVRWIGKISYGLYLWHLPVIIELDQQRTGLSGLELASVQIAVTFSISTLSFYLLERPIRRLRMARWPALARAGLAPAGMGFAALAVLLSTVPAAAAPGEKVIVSPSAPGAGDIVTRASRRSDSELHVALPAGVPSRADPLRVMLVGDSVMMTQVPAIEAALDSTGEAEVYSDAADGWGLTVSNVWATQMPAFIRRYHPQLIVAMWSRDNSCLLPTPRPPGSCTLTPSRYRALLVEFERTLLAPGDGVSGIIFEQYPPLGGLFSVTQEHQRVEGELAWDSLVSSMPAEFPGRVVYLPLASAVELDGRFTDWLPPETDPDASKSQWVRVRMLDNTHFCPAGAARYAAALLSDLTLLYHLPPPSPNWSTASWTNDAAIYDQPPGSCPDDHP